MPKNNQSKSVEETNQAKTNELLKPGSGVIKQGTAVTLSYEQFRLHYFNVLSKHPVNEANFKQMTTDKQEALIRGKFEAFKKSHQPVNYIKPVFTPPNTLFSPHSKDNTKSEIMTLRDLDHNFEKYLYDHRNDDYLTLSPSQRNKLEAWFNEETTISLDDIIKEIQKETFAYLINTHLETSYTDPSSSVNFFKTLPTLISENINEVTVDLIEFKRQRLHIIKNQSSTEKKSFDMIAFDADLTLITGHLHNACATHMKKISLKGSTHMDEIGKHYDFEEQEWDKLYQDVVANEQNHILFTGQPNQWRQIFEDLHANGYKSAIVSYTSFKPALERFLKDKVHGLGLSDELFNNIVIITGLPEEQLSKTKHIIAARKQHGFSDPDNLKTTILIDDSKTNIRAHEDLYGTGIQVSPGGKDNPSKVEKELETKCQLSKKASIGFTF